MIVLANPVQNAYVSSPGPVLFACFFERRAINLLGYAIQDTTPSGWPRRTAAQGI